MFGAMADPNTSMAQHHRVLVLHGTLKNVSSDPLGGVTCPTKLTVHFKNGRSAEASVDDVCGDTELLRANVAMGGSDLSSLANLTLDADREYSFGLDETVATLLPKVGNGPALHGKYHSYPIDKVILIVDFAGKTAFGDTVNGRLVETEIPVPSETSAFAIVG